MRTRFLQVRIFCCIEQNRCPVTLDSGAQRDSWKCTFPKTRSSNRVVFITRIIPKIFRDDASCDETSYSQLKYSCELLRQVNNGNSLRQPHCNTLCVFGMLHLRGEHGWRASRSGPISVPAEAVAHFATNYYQMHDITSLCRTWETTCFAKRPHGTFR